MKAIAILIALLGISEFWLLQSKTKIQIWKSLKEVSSSVAVTPQILILRRNFQDLFDKEGIATVPLGSRSKSKIVFCDESEGMIYYDSDRYGFRNPDDVWDKGFDIAMVGDSFAQGACVKDGDDIASALRPEFGNVLNLGSLGNGPLGNLAIVAEYLRDAPPKRLLWFYVANDFVTDLPIEEQTPLIAAYRDPRFSQSLKFRQADLDGVIDDFLKVEADTEGKRPQLMSHLKLTNVQNALTKAVVQVFRTDPVRQGMDMDYAKPDLVDYEVYHEILRLARAMLPQTEIDLVIIPDAGMYSKEHKAAAAEHIGKLKQVAASLQMNAIDLREAFRDVERPLRMYAVESDSSYGHFTPEGYHKVSDYLKGVLKKTESQASR